VRKKLTAHTDPLGILNRIKEGDPSGIDEVHSHAALLQLRCPGLRHAFEAKFTHGNAEKLKFCTLKIGKSNYECLLLPTIVTKTVGSDMPAVGSGEKENARN
jgi:hypothetical protein